MPAADEFIAALGERLPDEQRIILCGFVGDPDAVGLHAWRPRAWREGAPIPFNERCNVYATVGSFRRAADGSWRRRAEAFASGRALMIDDIGTKVDEDVLDMLPPSAIVETSPGNRQAWYFLSEPIYDRARFDAIIRAFILQRLLGVDPGMASVTRVGRLPGFVNGKTKWDGWRCCLLELNDNRYTGDELLEAFHLELHGTNDIGLNRLRPAGETVAERDAMFHSHLDWLRANNFLRRTAEPDMSGWIQITCPWVDEHSNKADTGAAIRIPSTENEWYGAFRCHHGHCETRGWKDLTERINAISIDQLEQTNRTAADDTGGITSADRCESGGGDGDGRRPTSPSATF